MTKRQTPSAPLTEQVSYMQTGKSIHLGYVPKSNFQRPPACNIWQVLKGHIHSASPDVLYPTLPGCLFSWLVSTTYQDAMALS